MKVKELCDALMDRALITIVADRSCCIELARLTTNELRWSSYRERKIELIRAIGVGLDHFTIKLEEN